MPFASLIQKEPLVVLGIDPGTYAMGYGVVGRRSGSLHEIDHGVMRAPRTVSIEQRLRHISDDLEQLLDHHRPDVISLEEAFVQKNVQSALRLGEARGVVLLHAARREVPVVQFPTAVAKKAVCGHGGADKATVQSMVSRHLGLSSVPSSHDAADALALALCLLFDPRLDSRLAEN